MSEPLFIVGEDVLLVSKDYPEDNGLAVVQGILFTGHKCITCGGNCHSYHLDIPDDGGGWCECALRKRPPPEEEFDTFRKKLGIDDKILETEDA